MKIEDYIILVSELTVANSVVLLLSLLILAVYKVVETQHSLARLIVILLILTTFIFLNNNYEIFINSYKISSINIFSSSINIDYLSVYIKLFLCFFALIHVSVISETLKSNKITAYEYYIVIMFSVLGLIFLCSCNDMLISYMAFELSTLTLYVLASFKKNLTFSIDSGIKYFITGSLSTGLFLLGVSFIYLDSGSMNFEDYSIPSNSITSYVRLNAFRNETEYYLTQNSLVLPLSLASEYFKEYDRIYKTIVEPSFSKTFEKSDGVSSYKYDSYTQVAFADLAQRFKDAWDCAITSNIKNRYAINFLKRFAEDDFEYYDEPDFELFLKNNQFCTMSNDNMFMLLIWGFGSLKVYVEKMIFNGIYEIQSYIDSIIHNIEISLLKHIFLLPIVDSLLFMNLKFDFLDIIDKYSSSCRIDLSLFLFDLNDRFEGKIWNELPSKTYNYFIPHYYVSLKGMFQPDIVNNESGSCIMCRAQKEDNRYHFLSPPFFLINNTVYPLYIDNISNDFDDLAESFVWQFSSCDLIYEDILKPAREFIVDLQTRFEVYMLLDNFREKEGNININLPFGDNNHIIGILKFDDKKSLIGMLLRSYKIMSYELANRIFKYNFIFDQYVLLNQILNIGLPLILFSFLIKIGLAPFHLWAIDVYEGSPTSSTIFFSVISKISIIVLMIRVFFYNFREYKMLTESYLLIIGVLSVFIGTLGGIIQRRLKILLTYSSISNIGFVIVAFSTANKFSVSVTIFYLLVYMLVSFILWSTLYLLRAKNQYGSKFSKDMGDIGLLNVTNSVLSLSILLSLFSLAGVPPMIGFVSKLLIIISILYHYSADISILIIVFSVVSVFYYIRIIKIIYFENMMIGKLYYNIYYNQSLTISLCVASIFLLLINPTTLIYITDLCSEFLNSCIHVVR